MTTLAKPEPDELIQAIADQADIGRVKELLDRGADVNACDEGGTTGLMYASLNNYLEIAELLLNRGADPNIKNPDKETALMMNLEYPPEATEEERTEMTALLLKHGADVTLKDEEGWTALFHAAKSRHLGSIKLIAADPRTDINAQDDYGFTPLMYGAMQGHAGIVDHFLEAGADLGIKTAENKTILDLVEEGDVKNTLIAAALSQKIQERQKEAMRKLRRQAPRIKLAQP